MLHPLLSGRPEPSGTLPLLLLPFLLAVTVTGGAAQAQDGGAQGQALSSGHGNVPSTWYSGHGRTGNRGLALTFHDMPTHQREAMGRAALNDLRRTAQDTLAELALRRLDLEGKTLDVSPAINGLLSIANAPDRLTTAASESLTVRATRGHHSLELIPSLNGSATLSRLKASGGLRLQWNMVRDRTQSSRWPSASAFAAWTARSEVRGIMSKPTAHGRHDVEAGLGLALGGWSMSVDMRLPDAGLGPDPEPPAASGWVGYAVRF